MADAVLPDKKRRRNNVPIAAAATRATGTAQKRARVPTYNTIFDFMIAYKANKNDIQTYADADKLYFKIAEYLVNFSMADHSHDFRDLNVNVKLDAKAGTKSIGNFLIEKSCEAFYVKDMTLGSPYKTLFDSTSATFRDYLGSDGKAKKYIFNEMPRFFNDIKTNYSAFFNPNSYDRLFEATAKIKDAVYNNNASMDRFITTFGQRDEPIDSIEERLAILIDSQNGNPTKELFMREGHKGKVSYYTNFSSILDSAPKPTKGVEAYFKVFVQTQGLPINIDRMIGIYATDHRLSNLRFDKQWNIDSSFTRYNGAAAAVNETYSSVNKASVNNQGVFKSRNVGDDPVAAINTQVIKNVDIDKIGLNHHIKGCGDRYQGFAFSKIDDINRIIQYNEYPNLQSAAQNPGEAQPINDERAVKVIFTLDQLFVRQMYGMQVNTVYCGIDKLTYYEFVLSNPPTAETVRSKIRTKKAKIRTEVQSLLSRNIDFTSISTLLNTIFDAIENKNAHDYCSKIPILESFTRIAAAGGGGGPTDDQINRAITDSNFKQFMFIHDNYKTLAQKIKEMTRDSIITKAEFLKKFNQDLRDALNNTELSLIGLDDATVSTLIKRYFYTVSIVVEDIKSIFTNFYVDNYLQLLAHLIVLKHNMKRINLKFYKKDILYKYTIDIGRNSPMKQYYENVREHFFKPDYTKVDTIFKILFDKIIVAINAFNPSLAVPAPDFCLQIDQELDRYSRLFDAIIAALPADQMTDNDKDLCKQIYSQMNTWFSNALALKTIKECMNGPAEAINKLYRNVLQKNGFNPTAPVAALQLEADDSVASAAEAPKVPGAKFAVKISNDLMPDGRKAKNNIIGDAAMIVPIKTAIEAQAIPAAAEAPSSYFTNLKNIFRQTNEWFFGTVNTITNIFDVQIFGGGSRSRKTNKSDQLPELVKLKLQLMQDELSNSLFNGISYLRSENNGLSLVSNMRQLRKSKKAPVLLTRLKGGRMNTRKLESSRDIKSRSGTRSNSREKLLFAQGSRMQSIHLSQTGKSKSRIISHNEGLDYLKRQMLAFIVLGFDITDEEVSVCKKYLPELADLSMARVHHHLFWLPFIEASNIEWPTLKAIYDQSMATLKSKYDESVPLSMTSISRRAEAFSRAQNNLIGLKSNQNRDVAELDREITTLKSQRKASSQSRADSKSRQSILKSLSRDVAAGYSEIEA